MTARPPFTVLSYQTFCEEPPAESKSRDEVTSFRCIRQYVLQIRLRLRTKHAARWNIIAAGYQPLLCV
jgi:hypothetical protein